MSDLISSMAFEMQSSKGVFALLLGSGVSYSAKIPTGWEITLDLVRKLAVMTGEDSGSDPETWYRQTFNSAPDYSDLLNKLGSTPTLRQEIIRKYIEPTTEERDRGEKQPTIAHRAVADLMAAGYVRVVLTTNFDRLLEQALSDIGVQPAVISSPDHVRGALPLIHAGPTIIKLHGDYLDTRIRNTALELDCYEPELDQLLDRVFDEFGLIVCGWSAEWDVALKNAMDRMCARRYPMYFTSIRDPRSAAEELIKRRHARVVKISGADDFFEKLKHKVEAIASLKKPDPRSASLAVALLKKYMLEPRHKIDLYDLVNNEVRRALAYFESDSFPATCHDQETFCAQILAYDSTLEILIAMAYAAGRWCTLDQVRQWAAVIRGFGERALQQSDANGTVGDLSYLRRYPGVVVMYAFCLGALVEKRISYFGLIAGEKIDLHGGVQRRAAVYLNAPSLLKAAQVHVPSLNFASKSDSPASEHLADLLRPLAIPDLHSERRFDAVFAEMELAFAFAYASDQGDNPPWLPIGRSRYDFTLNNSLIEKWRRDEKVTTVKSDLRVMAALDNAPKITQVSKFADGSI